MRSWKQKGIYCALIFTYLVYSCTVFFTRAASTYDFMSGRYLYHCGGAVAILGIYAIIWQQIIKHMPLSNAFMFKGTTIIWTLLISNIFFEESISMNNIIGSILIIIGITIYAKS